MKKITLIILALLNFNFKVQANEGHNHETEVSKDCETSFLWNNEIYCLQIEWLPAEKRTPKGLEETDHLSPIANPENPSPIYKTLFSKAHITLEKSGEPALIEGFNAKLFMSMLNGMHHSGPSKFEELETGYLLSEMNFTQMKGCWSVELYIDSEKLGTVNVTGYSNLSQTENIELLMFCDVCSSAPPVEGGHEHTGH